MQTVGKLHTVNREFDFEWRIEDFLSLSEEVGKIYSSRPFSFAGESWYLRIYPSGRLDLYSGCISVYLRRISSDTPISLAWSFGLKTFDGKRAEERQFMYKFSKRDESHGVPKLLKRSELSEKKSELLPSGVLTIVCALEYVVDTGDTATVGCSYCKKYFNVEYVSSHEGKCLYKPIKCPTCDDVVVLNKWFYHECQTVRITVDTSDENIQKDETNNNDERSKDEGNNEKKFIVLDDKGINKLLENFRQIFLDGRMSDAVLKLDGREFNVHKMVLVAQSPVFASMFEHDLSEKNDNVVDIPDCTPESFEVFLHYLYCGRADVLSTSNVYNVYYAADKYQVDELKEKCVGFMIDNISVETFCDVIALSLRHGESELQKTATDFFCQNIKKIIKTVQWQVYLDENSTQANELLIKALNA